MAMITSAGRSNISELLSMPLESGRLSKSSQSVFANNIEQSAIYNAAESFTKLPSQTSFAGNLFNKMACCELPGNLDYTHSDWKVESVINMLGIIYKDSEVQDLPKFEKVFRELEKVDEKFSKDKKVSSELSFLFAKYGENALRKHITEYMQHCRNAWEYHHSGYDKSITDEVIFTPSVMACTDILETQIKALSQPNQTWTTIICAGAFVKVTCVALSKTLKYHDAVQPNEPLSESPLRNKPASDGPFTSGTFKPEGVTDPGKPGISIPAGQGHGPITINNTAHGGNGVSTVNGNTKPTSDIDFGIALLNTPNDQLGNDKARLVEKFIDLHWGRAQNSGQDKFIDHLDEVTLPKPARIVSLPVLQEMHAVEELVTMPARQFSSAVGRGPQAVIERVLTTTITPQLAESEESVSDLQSQQSSPLTLQSTVREVSRSLSNLLSGVNSSLISTNGLSEQVSHSYIQSKPTPQFATMTNIETKNAAQSLTINMLGENNNASTGQGGVQQLAQKFEKLNFENHMRNIRNESNVNHNNLETAVTAFKSPATNLLSSSSQKARNAESSKTDFWPLNAAQRKIKVNANQNPLYTTRKTIDPLSRHYANLRDLSTSFNQKPETEEMPDKSDSVSHL